MSRKLERRGIKKALFFRLLNNRSLALSRLKAEQVFRFS